MRQKKKSHGYYDGAPYAFFVERLTKGLHNLVAGIVPDNCRMIDICCGTGALARLCASKCEVVCGVDISPRMIDYADRQQKKLEIENLRYQTADARNLSEIDDGDFDVATLVMCLHEMPTTIRPEVLKEAQRIAKTVLILDFVPEMHWNLAGIRNRLVEFAAGPRHFRGFLDFTRRGGLPPLLDGAELEVQNHRVIDQGNLEIYLLSRRLRQRPKTASSDNMIGQPA